MRIAKKHELLVIEDATQGVMASYNGRALGSIGDLGAYSFHETKNVISGEGGALAVNRVGLISEAEIIREKGTDRSRFLRGSVDKYTWQSLGSSFLPGEIIAAFLWAQLQEAQEITDKRCHLWNRYNDLFENLENQGLVTRPHVPEQCEHNAHVFYLILAPQISRKELLDFMATKGVNAVFHYVPLHTSPAGRKFSRHSGDLTNTVNLSERLFRLPLWIGLNPAQQQIVYDSVFEGLNKQ